MGRYYFDIQNATQQDGTRVIRDDEGTEYDSLEAAVRAAAHSAAEIGQDRLSKGDTSDVVIDVRDEHNRRLVTVTASMRIDRHAAPS